MIRPHTLRRALGRTDIVIACLLAFAYPLAGVGLALFSLSLWGRGAARLTALLLALSALSPLVRLVLHVLG